MNKKISVLLIFITLLLMFSGCGKTQPENGKFEVKRDETFTVSVKMADSGDIKSMALSLYLDDDAFERIIIERSIILRCKHKLGKITEEELMRKLGIGNGMISDYLLDFNFFLFSEKTNRYYTSRMEFRDDRRYRWSKRQWDIYYELYEAFSFDKLVAAAMIIFEKELEDYLNENGEDGMFYIEEYLLNHRPNRGFE